MSDINNLLLEAIEALNPYKALNDHIRSANRFYNKAIKCHNSGDSAGFMDNFIKHHEHEHGLHFKLATPNYLNGGSKVQSRAINSHNYLHSLYDRVERW